MLSLMVGASMARRPRPHLADSVYTALRRALVEGQFDSGEPLTEQELSRRFKVSRTPIREALAKLERDHLVRVVPKKGAFVRTASHDEIRELYQIREALEALTVRLAAPRVDREALAGFEARFRELEGRPTPPRYTEIRPLGDEFHAFLVKQAGNDKLAAMLDQIRGQLRSVWTMSILGPRRVTGLIHEHLALIGALQRGDRRRAERLMTAHVRRVRDTIFRLLD
jgi:DNA-binding GntR family transcriptional regulator